MCVAYSVIDVQIELENACFTTSASVQAAAPSKMTFTASAIQASTPQPHASHALSVSRLTTLQYGQPRHFIFKLQRSGSFSVRALAIVHGSSVVALACVDPQPKFHFLTEQRALASYMQAVGKCSYEIVPVHFV
jgi:hypothetical protein